MTSQQHDSGNPDSFDDTMVSGLLRIAFNPARRPVDHLIERLQQGDGMSWFNEALSKSVIAQQGDPEQLLIRGGAKEEQLGLLKDTAKTEFGEASDATVRLRGLMTYLFIIAAGLEHYGVLLSSQPRGEISSVLLELALSLPAPWNDFIAEAAMTPMEAN